MKKRSGQSYDLDSNYQNSCRPVKASGDIGPVERVKIEDMFGKCWSIPNAGPPLPTIITVQAPAGIGKHAITQNQSSYNT